MERQRGMRTRRAVATLAVLTASGTACGAGEDSATGCTRVELGPAAELDAAALGAAFDDWEAGADGGGVAAVRRGPGEPVLLATGADATTGEPLQVTSRVRVGSISKTFVAAMVLQLVDDGRVDLDEALSTYLPSTRLGADVTVRQLLAHRSGIANYTEDSQYLDAALSRPDREASPDDVLSFVREDDALFDPGDEYSYSNTNYILAGQLIEAVSGRTLDAQLTEAITRPLGLTDTFFDDGNAEGVASGFSAATPSGTTGDQSYRSIATSAWAAGSLVSSVGDLATFADALMTGRIISDESFAEMSNVDTDVCLDYGLGLFVTEPFGLGHNGSILGFNSIMQREPSTGDLLIVVVNNDLRQPSVIADELWELAAAA